MNPSRIVWLLAACCFTMSCSQQFILGIPSAIAASAGIALSEVGQLMTVFGLANAIGAPLILILTARRSQRSQLVVGLALLGAGMLLMGSTSDYAALLTARVIMGAGNGTFTATATAMAARIAEPGHAGRALSNVSLGFSLSQVLAMPLARTLSPYVDWHVFYLVLAAISLAAAVVLTRVIPGGIAADAQTGIRERLAPLAHPVVALALGAMFAVNLGFSSFYTYITPFLESVFGASGHAVSTVLLVAGCMSVVGSKGSGWVSDRFGCTTTIPIALVMQVVTLAGIGLFYGSPAFTAVAMCLWVIFDWSFIPAQNLLLSRICGSSASMVIALGSSALQLGSAAGPAVGGTIILKEPLGVLPFVACGCIACALLLEAIVLRRVHTGKRPRPENAPTPTTEAAET